MESTQHRLREYDDTLATTMSSRASRGRGSVLRRIGHTGRQRHVQQLVGDALLTPQRVLGGHASDELTQCRTED